MLTVRIDDKTSQRIARLAKASKRTKSYFVKEALERYLEDEEELEFALAAHRKFLEGDQKTYTYEEVMRRNGLLDETPEN